MSEEKPLKQQVGGTHYLDFGMFQPFIVFHQQMTPDEFRGFMLGTAQAYLVRRKHNRREDIQKAVHTLQCYLALTEDEDSDNGKPH